MATGEYILFVDSDDYIDIEMIRRLYDALVKTGADMSVCNIRMVGVDGLTTFPYPENVVRDEEMDEAYIGEKYMNRMRSVMWLRGISYTKNIYGKRTDIRWEN